MGQKDLRHVIAGMLVAIVINMVGWLLAFVAGANKPPIRTGWGQGLLSNIPLGVMIIICMLIYIFDEENKNG